MKLFLKFIGLIVIYIGSVNADVELNDGTVLSDKPSWIVTYIEVGGDLADEAKSLLNDQMEAGKQQQGNLRFEVVQRISRDNHFVVLEAWVDPQARSEHAGSEQTVAFRKALQPLLYAPYDERPHVGLETGDVASMPLGNADTIYVVTHADLIPPEQFAPCERAANPQGPCGNDLITGIAEKSRSHDGNLRFDVLTQSNRSNHMTVVEMWQDSSAQAAHQMHQEKKDFRDQLSGVAAQSGVSDDPQFVPNMLTGSLWDERLYKLID